MNHSKYIAALLLLFFEGCSHYYYVPNSENVPLLKEKKEAKLSGGYGFGDYSNNVEIQLAYAAGKHFGLTSSFQRAWGGDYPQGSYGRGIYFEAGPGYYTTFSGYGVFEAYSGIGHGSEHHGYINVMTAESYGTSYIELTRFYMQPAIGIRYEFVEVAFSTRLSVVNFNKIANNVNPTTGYYTDVSSLSTGAFTWIEPAATARLSLNNVGIQFQALYSQNLNSPEIYFGERWHFNIGAFLKFGPGKGTKTK
ncbi:MAG: hypothetical protein U0T33_01590 [Bacteroidales bacterium]